MTSSSIALATTRYHMQARFESKGILVMVGAPNDIPVTSLVARLIRAFSIHVEAARCAFSSRSTRRIDDLREFMGTGKVTPVIDRRYRFSEVREAFRYAAEGHTRGKLIIMPDLNAASRGAEETI